MKKNIFLREMQILMFVFTFFYQLSIVNGQVQKCGSGVTTFTLQAGTCGNGLSIQCTATAVPPGSKSIFSISGQVNTYAGGSVCISVPTLGAYTITHTVISPIAQDQSASCTFAAKTYTPPPPVITYATGLPDDPIKNVTDEKLPVGSIKGLNSVSPTGAATYSIPVALPSGTKGVEPSLSFEYNGQTTIGLMGFGWNISGLSSITRVSKDDYHDNRTSTPQLSDSDGFALDGNRLILLSGEYGKPNSVYGTKNETFARITLKVSFPSTYFEVETKSGMKMQYGYTIDARMSNANHVAVIWQLNRSEDQYGNYMEYKYALYQNGMVLKEILYAGNEKAKIAPYNKVTFDYTSKFDINNGFIAGVQIDASALLQKVTILAEGSLFRRYEFSYVRDDIHSYLRELKVFDGNNNPLNPTTFQYGTKNEFSYGTTNLRTILPSYSANKNPVVGVGDFNGDGLSDVLDFDKVSKKFRSLTKNQGNNDFTTNNFISSSNNTVYAAENGLANQINFLAQDFDGDGYDDVPVLEIDQEYYTDIVYENEGNTPNVATLSRDYVKSIGVHHSQGNGNFNPVVPYPISSTYKYALGKRFIITGDFDADSRADYITILSDMTSYSAAVHFPALNSLNNAISINKPSSYNGLYATIEQDLAFAPFAQTIDFNGDGKSEILIHNGKMIVVFELIKNANGYQLKFLAEYRNDNIVAIYTGDFNGDSKTDLLLGVDDGKDQKFILSEYKVILSTGLWYQYSHAFLNPGSDLTSIGDLNGDGISDIVFSKSTEYVVHANGPFSYILNSYDVFYSRGLSFFRKNYNFSDKPIPQVIGAILSSTTISSSSIFHTVGDFNGDGKTELLWQNNAYVSFFANSTNHLLEKVVDGYGRAINFEYENATKGSIYQKGSAHTYPYTSTQTPMWLVKSMNAPDGVGSITKAEYKYNDMQLHRGGLGFLGCASVTIKNQKQGTETYSEFYTIKNKQGNYSAVNHTLKLQREFKDGQMVSEIENSYDFAHVGNGRWWLKNTGSNSINGVTNAIVKSTIEYDSYGNVRSQYSDNNGVEQSIMAAEYEQRGSWIPSSPTLINATNTWNGQTFSKSTKNTYNDQGTLIQSIDFYGNAKAVTTDYKLNDDVGLAISSTISAANVKTQRFDYKYSSNFRFLEETTNPLGQVSSVNYDGRWGKPKTVTDIAGLTTSFEYDGLGRAIKLTTPQGYDVNTHYYWGSSFGGLFHTLVEHPGKPDVREHFDLLERSIAKEVEGFQGKGWLQSSQVYDHLGNVVQSFSPEYNGTGVVTHNEYDYLNRLKSTFVPGKGITSFDYDYINGGTKVTTLTTAGHTFSSTTDVSGRVIEKIDYGGKLQHKYNGQGLQTEVKLDGKVTVTMMYDGVGHRTSMKDINAGTNSYRYDPLGRLLYQKTARDYVTTYDYDVIGRPVRRQGAEGLTTYDYTKSGGGINQIWLVKGYNGFDQTTIYDGYGRVKTHTETIKGKDYTHSYDYDKYNNQILEVYPTGFTIKRDYDDNSYLTKVGEFKNQAMGTVFFDATDVDQHGNYSKYKLGNGLTTTNTYTKFGLPENFTTSGAMDMDFNFNTQSGNLDYRRDNIRGILEDFTYDNLDRLETAITSFGGNTTMGYNSKGNILNKSDAGKYFYGSAKVNAVTQINAAKNINLATHEVLYTPFEQPDEIKDNISRGVVTLRFDYGADYQRRYMEFGGKMDWAFEPNSGNKWSGVANPGAGNNPTFQQLIYEKRFYVGNYEEDHIAPVNGLNTTEPSNSRLIHYIAGGDGICAIMVRNITGENTEGIDSIFYVHKDYLGSFLAFTGEEGNVLYEQNFDAWGRYRNIKDWSYVNIQHRPLWMYRGFTGHEHLVRTDHIVRNGKKITATLFDLINMNGRLYDPTMGRMLSVDNIHHDGAGSQGYNGYSYAMNNPLKYTDPDGENPVLIVMGIGAVVGVVMNGIANLDAGQSFWKDAGHAAIAGAVQGAWSFGIGQIFLGVAVSAQSIALQAGVHGLLGGISSAGSGGKFWAGFASGAIGSVIGSGVGRLKLTGAEAFAVSMAAGGLGGGISSKLAGGTFEDGFRNGLISAGLNHGLHAMAAELQNNKVYYNVEIGLKDNSGGTIGAAVVSIEFTPSSKGLKYSGYALISHESVANLEVSLLSVVPVTASDVQGVNINVEMKAAQFNYGSISTEHGVSYSVLNSSNGSSTNLYIGGGQATIHAFVQFNNMPFLLNSQSTTFHPLKGYAISTNTNNVYVRSNMNSFINSTILWQNGKPSDFNGNYFRKQN